MRVLLCLGLVLALSLTLYGQEAAETNSRVIVPNIEPQHLNDTDVVNASALDHPGPLYSLPVQSNSSSDPEPSSIPTVSGNTTTEPVHVDTNTCGVRNPDGTVRPLRIMTSSTAEYFPVFMNWLVYYHKICPNVSNIYFICLDAAVEKILPKHGFTCAHVFHSSIATALHDIWLVRTKLTHDLLHKGYDVLLTDSDALWVNNPFPLLEQHISSDVISSRGSFPDSVSKTLGATLCMGFVYIKASAHTTKLWSEIADQMAKQPNPDDQKEVNSILFNHKLKYAQKLRYVGSETYDTGHFQLNEYRYSVTLLPHTLFRRICDQEKIGDIQSSVVVHCLSSKAGHSKISTARALGIWQLKDNWDKETLQGDLVAYLDRLTTTEGVHRVVRALLVRGVRRLYIHTSKGNSSATSSVGASNLYNRALRGSHGSGEIVGTRNTIVCLEYHQNKHVYNTTHSMTDDNCWYVSTDAPDRSIRQFEELTSAEGTVL